MKGSNGGRDEPDWAERASECSTLPDWQDFIPRELWELGEVFFPIPRGQKGWSYPHHLQSYRHTADSEILNAYFEQGWGYGIACSDPLVVVDIDNLDFAGDIVEKLPGTLWQYSGSGEGIHLFYFVEGLNTRQNLYAHFLDDRIDEDDIKEEGDYIHIGEVKCDPHGYVVGPGSVHPSGNTYGPLRGESIATVSKKDILGAIVMFQKPETDTASSYNPEDYSGGGSSPADDKHPFYKLTAKEVLPGLEPGKRVAHPVHGSDTGMNFMVNDNGKTFTCWRCQYGGGTGCGLNGVQYLASEATGMDCEDVRRNWHRDSSLHYDAWVLAVKRGLVGYSYIPYKVLHGYAAKEGVLKLSEKLAGRTYYEMEQALKYEMEIMIAYE